MIKKSQYITIVGDESSEDSFESTHDENLDEEQDEYSSSSVVSDYSMGDHQYAEFKVTGGEKYAEFSLTSLNLSQQELQGNPDMPNRRRSMSPSSPFVTESNESKNKDPLSYSTSTIQARRRATRDERRAIRQQNQPPSSMANRKRTCDRGRVKRRNRQTSPGPLRPTTTRRRNSTSPGPLTPSSSQRRTVSSSPHSLRRTRKNSRSDKIPNSMKSVLHNMDAKDDDETTPAIVVSSSPIQDPSRKSIKRIAKRRSQSPHDVISKSSRVKALYSGLAVESLQNELQHEEQQLEKEEERKQQQHEQQHLTNTEVISKDDDLTDLQEMIQAAKRVSIS